MSKGPIQYSGTEKGKGLPGRCPGVSEKKKGPIVYSGAGGNKGIPPAKPGKGKGSDWAGTHD